MFKFVLPIFFLVFSCSPLNKKDNSKNTDESTKFYSHIYKIMPLKLEFDESPDSPASYYHQMILEKNGKINPLPEYKENAIRVDSGSWKIEANILELNITAFNALCELEPCTIYMYDQLKIPLKIKKDKIQFPKYVK